MVGLRVRLSLVGNMVAKFSLLGNTVDGWHSCVAQVSRIAMVLVVHFIILAVWAIVVVLPGETTLNPFVHGGTLQSLLGHLTLVVRTLIGHILLLAVTGIWHVATWGTAGAILLPLEIVVATGRMGVLTGRRITCSSRLPRLNVVLRAEVLHLSQDTEATLWRDQAWDNFLSNVFGGSSQEILQLNRAELLDYCALLAYALMESLLKFIELSLLLV